MAKIVKSSLQLTALKEVNEKIKLMQKINKVMKDADESANGSLNIKLGDGRITYNNDANFVRKVMLSLKRETLNSINKKCAKFNIELDDAEKTILGIFEKEVAEEIAEEHKLEGSFEVADDMDISASSEESDVEPEPDMDDEDMPDAMTTFGSVF